MFEKALAKRNSSPLDTTRYPLGRSTGTSQRCDTGTPQAVPGIPDERCFCISPCRELGECSDGRKSFVNALAGRNVVPVATVLDAIETILVRDAIIIEC